MAKSRARRKKKLLRRTSFFTNWPVLVSVVGLFVVTGIALLLYAHASAPPCNYASYPSRLKTSGRNIVDSNGCVLPMMKSFNVGYQYPQTDFNTMSSQGVRMVRVLVAWNKFEPTQGSLAMGYITGTIDPIVQRAVAAHLYVQMEIAWNASDNWPSWAGTQDMGDFLAYGQMPVQFIANRYGNPSSLNYLNGLPPQSVIGFGVDEPHPDNPQATNVWPNLEAQERTVISWIRAYAPNWIGIVSGPYGGNTPIYNASCAAENGLQINAANASETAYDSVGGNVILDVHDYSEGATTASPNYDGRDYYGGANDALTQSGKMAKVKDSVPAQYPSPYDGSQNRSVLQTQLKGFMCPYVQYAANYDGGQGIPLMIGEFGWTIGPSTTSLQAGSGYSEYLSDQEAAWNTASPVVEEEWDFSQSQANGQDPWAAYPLINGTNEWQPFTSQWLNSFPPSPSPTPTPTATSTPTPTASSTPVPSTSSSPTSTPSPNPAAGSSGGGSGTGNIQIVSPSQQAKVTVDGVAVATTNGKLDTTYLTNGPHVVKVTEDGKTLTTTIQVHNHLNLFEELRDLLFARFTGNHLVMNMGTVLVILLPFLVLTLSLKSRLAHVLFPRSNNVRTNLS